MTGETSNAAGPSSADPTSTGADPTGPAETETTTESATPTTPAGATDDPGNGEGNDDTVETYIYYVVDTRNDFLLAREIHDVPEGPDGVVAAIEAMISGPDDPDYTSAWNRATVVRGVDLVGDVITVDLSADARTANVGSPGAAMLILQLVWTATEAAKAPNAAVQLTIDGEVAGELWGAVNWDEPIPRTDPLGVRGVVQIDTPREGAEVTSPVTVSGDAAAFEAHVPWRILDSAGEEIESGFTMTTEGNRFAPFTFDVELEPGQYTVEIIQDDPSGGEAGEPYRDTRTITVTG